MTTTKRGHCCSRSAFGKVRFSGHKFLKDRTKMVNFQIIVMFWAFLHFISSPFTYVASQWHSTVNNLNKLKLQLFICAKIQIWLKINYKNVISIIFTHTSYSSSNIKRSTKQNIKYSNFISSQQESVLDQVLNINCNRYSSK